MWRMTWPAVSVRPDQLSEYWYMGSMLAMSRMQKKSTELYSPHGLYHSLGTTLLHFPAQTLAEFGHSKHTMHHSIHHPIHTKSDQVKPESE